MAPGEIFYLFEQLDTAAMRDAREADAFGTLTVQFDQPEFVRSLSVPEPSMVVLAALGLAAMVMANLRSGRRNGRNGKPPRDTSTQPINERQSLCEH